jgi:hypothetical protein
MNAPSDFSRYAFAVDLDLQPWLRSKQVEVLTTFEIGELYVKTILHQVSSHAKLDLHGNQTRIISQGVSNGSSEPYLSFCG